MFLMPAVVTRASLILALRISVRLVHIMTSRPAETREILSKKKGVKKVSFEEYSPVIEHLPSMHKVLSSIPTPKEERIFKIFF